MNFGRIQHPHPPPPTHRSVSADTLRPLRPSFNACPNFLFPDSPFTPLDGNYLLTSDDNVAFGNDSLVAMVPGVTATNIATDPGSNVDVSLKQLSSGCHDYKPYGMKNITENMVQAQLSLSNGAIRCVTSFKNIRKDAK